jgi:8-oxo-dGTP pyrophosphatase MutT (NUDIX family)
MDQLYNLEKLKARFQFTLPGREAQFQMAPTFRPEMDESGITQKAGVIILLYLKSNKLYFPLIERPVYNGAHSGQISLPGGKMDSSDVDLIATALRECEEEIGIKASTITPLGKLSELFIPVSKFQVFPIVGFIEKITEFFPQPEEVSSIMEVPLELLLKESTLEKKQVIYNNKDEVIPFYNIFGKMVWGATAMILSEFTHVWKEVYATNYSDTKFL